MPKKRVTRLSLKSSGFNQLICNSRLRPKDSSSRPVYSAQSLKRKEQEREDDTNRKKNKRCRAESKERKVKKSTADQVDDKPGGSRPSTSDDDATHDDKDDSSVKGTPCMNEEFCGMCGQLLDDPELVYHQGNPQNALEESEAMASGKIELAEGYEGVSLCSVIKFSIFDKAGHMCRIDGNLIETGVELFMSGYLQSFQDETLDIQEDKVPVKDIGPITEWWTQSDDDSNRNQIRITTEIGEYNLVQPSDEYVFLMEELLEKVWLSKLLIDYLQTNNHLEPTFIDMVKAITKKYIPDLKNKKITEQMLRNHSKFLCEQVSDFDDEDDEQSLTSLPCMRELKKLSRIKASYECETTYKIKNEKKQRHVSGSFNSEKGQKWSKATSTPLVRKSFEALFSNQLEETENNEVPTKRICGVCEGCQQSDCGKCKNCKNMVKFGGPGIFRKVCLRKVCLLDRVNSESERVHETAFPIEFAEVETKDIDWPLNPIENTEEFSYYATVSIDGTEYKTGENVMIRSSGENTPSLVGRIVFIYRENKPPNGGYFHGELFMRSSDTVLGGTGNSKEIFMANHCCHGIPLMSIIQKAIVKKIVCLGDRFDMESEIIKEGIKENEPTFYCNKFYDRFIARFVDFPDDPICDNIMRKHCFCPSCERKTIMDFQQIPRLMGKLTENKVNIVENKITEWAAVKWCDFEYKKNVCVFLRPNALNLPNSYNKKNRENAKPIKVDETVYPEFYRKNKTTNFNLTARRAFGVGIIVDIISEGWGPLIDPHKIYLKVRIMYRPENTSCRAPQLEDLNVVFWSEQIKKVPFMSVVRPCQLFYEENIPTSVYSRRQWLEADPNRFYFHSGYNPEKGKNFKVPKEAYEFGKKYADNAPVKPLRTMDVFAGCGGLSAGLHQAGVADCRWAIENEKNAAEAYKLNNKNCEVIVEDCNTVLKEILAGSTKIKYPKKGEVDLICGGPPCQGFSGMNRFSSRDYSQFKNSLIVTFLSYCDFYRPKYFILENVRNFATYKKGILIKLTLRALLDMGYQCTFAVMQAGSYGIPQTRRRLIIMASAPGHKLPFYPEPINTFNRVGCRLSIRIDEKLFKSNISTCRSAPRRSITIFDAMSDLPEIENGADQQNIGYLTEAKTHFQKLVRVADDNVLLNEHICKKMSPLVVERIKHIPTVPGADWRDLPNIVVTLSDGTETKKLQYLYDDVKQGKSKTGQLRGVCSCASRNTCGKVQDKQDNTLIPWGMAHTANRNGNWSGIYGRIAWFNYFRTTITDPEPSGKQGRVLHVEQNRVVSLRECARSQGFCDSHVLSGGLMDKHRQVGNAVPPPMAAAIGRELKKALIATMSAANQILPM